MKLKTQHPQIHNDIESGTYRDSYLIYNRKSTDEPENQKNSIKYQKMENMRFASKGQIKIAHLTIPGFCTDGIISEKHSAFKENAQLIFGNNGTIQYYIDRPKFYNLVQYLHTGAFKGVIVLCWDRISRNKGDETVVRKLMKSGIDFKFVLATYDKSSSGALHMDIDGMFAEHHSRVTSEKVSLNTYNLRERGICTYRAPVGYLNTGSMEHKPLDPERAPIIKKLFEKYATGEYTLADLARYAILQGFTSAPIRRRKTVEEKLLEDEDDFQITIEPTSKIPTPNTIHKILINPFYTGKIVGNHGIHVKSSSHEALISQELFDSVQKVLKGRKVSVHYASKLSYPFRGIIRCDICKRVYTPYSKKGIIYYGARCAKSCTNGKRSFNAQYLSALIGLFISKVWFTESEEKEYTVRQSKNKRSIEKKRVSEIEIANRKRKKVREDLVYLHENKLSLLKTGVYTPEALMEEENKLNSLIENLQNSGDSFDRENQENITGLLNLSELLKNAYKFYDFGNLDEKEAIARKIFSELLISDKSLNYQCKNGLLFLQNRFIPSCAPKVGLSEYILPYLDEINQSIEDLNEIIANSHAPPKDDP